MTSFNSPFIPLAFSSALRKYDSARLASPRFLALSAARKSSRIETGQAEKDVLYSYRPYPVTATASAMSEVKAFRHGRRRDRRRGGA